MSIAGSSDAVFGPYRIHENKRVESRNLRVIITTGQLPKYGMPHTPDELEEDLQAIHVLQGSVIL